MWRVQRVGGVDGLPTSKYLLHMTMTGSISLAEPITLWDSAEYIFTITITIPARRVEIQEFMLQYKGSMLRFGFKSLSKL